MNRIFILFIVLLLQLSFFTSCEREDNAKSGLAEEGYISIQLRDGREFGGIIKERTDSTITLLEPYKGYLVFRYSELVFEQTGYFSERKAPVRVVGKWGFINNIGEIIIPPRYDDAYIFSDGRAAIKRQGFYGYIDTLGNFLIKPRLDLANSFTEGIAVIQEGEKVYLINTSGEKLKELEYEEWGEPSEGRIAVKDGDKWGFIDFIGNMVIIPQYEVASKFSEGLAAVIINERWGYIDTLGKVVIDPRFFYADVFSEGYTFVFVDSLPFKRAIMIDKQGNQVLEKKFSFAGQVKHGIIPVINISGTNKANANMHCMYLRVPSGEKITDMEFDVTMTFSEGFGPVKSEDKWGFIDTTGYLIFPPQYDDIGYFSEGLAPVLLKEGHWGFINTDGKLVIGF